MTVETFSILEANSQLSQLLELVAKGDSFTISDNGKPVTMVIPYNGATIHSAEHLCDMKGPGGCRHPGPTQMLPATRASRRY